VINAERGLVRAFYPEHISCLAVADPVQDSEFGLICQGCGSILGFPGERGAEPVATPREAHDAEVLSGGHEIEPEPDVDDWAAAAAEQQMIAEQYPEVGGAGVPGEPVQEPANPLVDAGQKLEIEPPWNEPERKLIAHEPVINAQPPDEEQGNLPEPHGSVAKSAVIPQDPIMAALDVIDPTRPYTPAEVESQLVDLEARLERGQHFQRVWEERAYRTKLAYTLAYDAALVRIFDEHRSPTDVRQAQARTENRDKFEDQQLAEMMVKAVRETMHNLRSQLSGYQSISRSVGVSVQAGSWRT
jgi:hypothetical protein